MEVVDGDMVVYKFFGRHKQWWHYGVEDWAQIEFIYQQAKKFKDA
jgi:hypothetical protein